MKSLIVLLLLAMPAIADWDPDVDGDGCIDQLDYDETEARLGGVGDSNYDVDGSEYVDQRDLDIIQSYLDRGGSTGDCTGFECRDEECNSEDDDCDGTVDEDEGMCSGNLECVSGQCVMVAGQCYDTDGRDYYTQGNAIGETAEGDSINNEEKCYTVDIYSKLKEAKQCYGEQCFLIEYWCDDYQTLHKEQLECEYGCRFGKCRNITKKCIENDNGLDIFRNTAGTYEANGKTINISDYCNDTNLDGIDDTLVEYQCLEDFQESTGTLLETYKTYEVVCACKDGACTGVVEKGCVDTDGNDRFTRGFTKGTTQESREVEDFDFCVEKIGQSFQKAEMCSGENCQLNEYSCDQNDQVIQYVHDCPLGCADGICVGTECARGETFVLAESMELAYDDNCDIRPAEAANILDMPGAKFNNVKDFACCSGSSEAYCVYNNVCYPSSRTHNFYEFDGEKVACGCADASCNFEDGNHAGLWFDLDSSKALCEGGTGECNVRWYPETGFKWLKPGEERESQSNIWEYEDSNEECCGDDSGEFIACSGSNCICCDSSKDKYSGGKCVQTAEEQSPPASIRPETGEEPEGISPEPVEEERSNIRIYMAIPIVVAILAVLYLVLTGRKKITPPET